jgi:hypothetical protein
MLVAIKFNVMQYMVGNNESKQLREIVKNINGSIAAHSDMNVSFKYGYNIRSLPYRGKVLLSQTQVKYMPKNKEKKTEQPFMTNPGISSIREI